MTRNLGAPQSIALIAAVISLTCACGIPLGPQDHYPPPSIKRSLNVTAGYLGFETKVGATSRPLRVTLKNRSNLPVELDKPSLYSIHNGAAFHLDTTCGATLNPDATCFIILTFSPNRKSNSEARLLFSAKPAESYGLIVQGTALKP